MRTNALLRESSSTERWLTEGFCLRSILALDVLAGSLSRGGDGPAGEDVLSGEELYLEKVCATVEIQDSYYCCGFEIEQLMIKSVTRIGQFSGTGKNVIELRGLPGSGCSTLSILGGHLLKNALQQPEDAKDTFDGITWPKVFYLSLRKPVYREPPPAKHNVPAEAAGSPHGEAAPAPRILLPEAATGRPDPAAGFWRIPQSATGLNGARGSPLPAWSPPPTNTGSASSGGTAAAAGPSPRRAHHRPAATAAEPRDPPRSNFDEMLSESTLAWTGLSMTELTSCIKRWFLYQPDRELAIVIDNAEPLCHNWTAAQQSLAIWMSIPRVNLILVNQSSDIFRPLTTPKRCVIRIGGLEPEQVATVLHNTRAKRRSAPDSSPRLSSPRAADRTTPISAAATSAGGHSNQPYSGTPSSCSQLSNAAFGSTSSMNALLVRNASPLDDYCGHSVMELLLEHFMELADFDETFAARLVVRWCMMLTGGLAKRIKTLCDSTIDAARKGQPVDPHELAHYLFTHSRPLFADLAFQRRLADVAIAAQVETYAKLADLLQGSSSSSGVSTHSTPRDTVRRSTGLSLTSILTNAPLNYTPAYTGGTQQPDMGCSNSISMLLSASGAAALNSSAFPEDLPSNGPVSGDCFGVLLKLISLQKSATPVDDRLNKILHAKCAISYDDDCLVKRDWYLRNRQRVVACGPELFREGETRSGTNERGAGSVGHRGSRQSLSSVGGGMRGFARDLVSFSPFMLYTHHDNLNRIARSYIRFSPTRSYHKGIFSWLSYRLLILPLVQCGRDYSQSGGGGAGYVDSTEAALIAGTQSWLDRNVWTNLLYLIYKIVRRHSAVWEVDRYKRLAIYAGFKVPNTASSGVSERGRSQRRSQADANITWLKYDTPVYQIFSKNCHKINSEQYSEIILHAFQSAQKGIVTIVLESFTKHIVVVSNSQACLYDIAEDQEKLAKRFAVIQKAIPRVVLKSCPSLFPDFL